MSNVTEYNLSTADVVKKWSRDNVKEFLQRNGTDLDLEENDINVIYGQNVTGRAFLRLKEEQLTRDPGPFRLLFGPASAIADVVKQINGEKGVEELTEELEELQLRTDESRKIKRKKEYMDTVKNSLEADPPSTSAKPNAFSVDQRKYPILNGRPLDLIGPPITIYNRAFSEFLENFENVNLDISSDIFDWVTDLIYASTEFYNIEDERIYEIREILSKKWTIDLIEYQRKSGKGRSCDGVFTCKIKNKLTAYIGFIEGKNEVGSGGCDPSVQGAIYYRDYWSQYLVQQIRNSCCVPSFIITVAGPWFCVLGAVFLNRIVVQPLTDTISFTVNPRNDVQVMRIARLFQALDIAFGSLCTFYQQLELSSSDRRFFPYIQQAGSGGDAFSFTYICELLDDHSRPIWKAMRDDNQRMIVVKFAHKYNIKAHNICARGNYAPELLYYSNDDEVKRLGGYKMIIMEYIDGISLSQKLKRGEIKTKNNIYADVENAIKLLHNEDLVFADLRTPNILVVDINECQRAKLIDFDWCGVHNRDRYPPSMNRDIKWPSGVKPHALLKKVHDLTWLDELNSKLLKNSIESSYIHQSPIASASRSSVVPQSPSLIKSSYISQIPITSTLGSSFIQQSSTASKLEKKCGCGCSEFSPSKFNNRECKNYGHPH